MNCGIIALTFNILFDTISIVGGENMNILVACEVSQEAFDFFMKFVNCNAKHICIENPVGYVSTHYRKPDQIIQPFYFGDPYQKRTCLWLFNLPKLQYTNIVEPEPPIIFKSGNSMPKWYYDACKIPAERSNIRSKTFPGIAEAITTQWNNL